MNIEKTSNELWVVDLSTVVKVHDPEDLLDILLFKVRVELFSKRLKSAFHLFEGDHSVTIVVKFDENTLQIFDLLLRNLHCKIHEHGSFETELD